MSWTYQKKTEKQLKDWYNDKVRNNRNGFLDFDDFSNWYNTTVQDRSCNYCGLSERESQKIIHYGLLTSKRFPLEGNTSQGVNRGYWLEIDKKNPAGIYSRENCVPCCYFCNNDKSDVFNEEQYRKFKENRIDFLRNILTEIQ